MIGDQIGGADTVINREEEKGKACVEKVLGNA